MEALFFQVLAVSGAVSAVLLLLLLLLPRWEKRYAPQTRRGVWLAVALVLLIAPLLPKAAAPVQVEVPRRAVTFPTPERTQQIVIAPSSVGGTQASVSGGGVQIPVPSVPAAGAEPAPARSSPTQAILWSELLAWLWLAGTAAVLLGQGSVYLMARRRLMRRAQSLAEWEPLAKQLCPRQRVRFYQTAGLDTPMTLGLLRPVVLLPNGYTPQVAVEHELYHIRRWDVAYQGLLLLSCAAHWFNPLVWWMSRRARRDMEASCDALAVAGADAAGRRAYGELLLRSAAKGNVPLTTQFGGGKALMKARLYDLFHPGKRSGALVCVILLASLLAGCLVACRQKDDTLYVNETYGFTLQLPESWAGRYTVQEDDGVISFFQKDPGESQDGKLCGLYVKDEWEFRREYFEFSDEEIEAQWPVPMRILGTGRGDIFYLQWVSDVRYDLNDPEKAAEYETMLADSKALGPDDFSAPAMQELTDGVYYARGRVGRSEFENRAGCFFLFQPITADGAVGEEKLGPYTLPMAEDIRLNGSVPPADEWERRVLTYLTWPLLRSTTPVAMSEVLELEISGGEVVSIAWRQLNQARYEKPFDGFALQFPDSWAGVYQVECSYSYGAWTTTHYDFSTLGTDGQQHLLVSLLIGDAEDTTDGAFLVGRLGEKFCSLCPAAKDAYYESGADPNFNVMLDQAWALDAACFSASTISVGYAYLEEEGPIQAVRAYLEAKRAEDTTFVLSIQELTVDYAETQRVAEQWIGSDLAQSRGWPDEVFTNGRFAAVQAYYYAEYDHTKVFYSAGNLEQFFYLIQDERGQWEIVDSMSPGDGGSYETIYGYVADLNGTAICVHRVNWGDSVMDEGDWARYNLHLSKDWPYPVNVGVWCRITVHAGEICALEYVLPAEEAGQMWQLTFAEGTAEEAGWQGPELWPEAFPVSLALPAGWSVGETSGEYPIIGAWQTQDIRDGTGALVGAIGFNLCDVYQGEEDNPAALYNQVGLGNNYQFDVREGYLPLAGNGLTAVTGVWHDPGNGVEPWENWGILSRNPVRQVYVAMELDRDSLTEEQVRTIAGSLMIY